MDRKNWVLFAAAGAYLFVGTTASIAMEPPLGRHDDPGHEAPEPKGIPAPVATALASGAPSSGTVVVSWVRIVEGIVGEETYVAYAPAAACERLLHSEQPAILDPGDIPPKPRRLTSG